MVINLEKMLRPSGAMKKTARDIKNTVRGTGNGKKSTPTKNKKTNKVINDMGFKPLGYWAKEFERFID